MQKKKKTSVLNLTLNQNRRYIFISDIHGDLKLLKKALKKINYGGDDVLFLLGDLIEKGDENLKMLDYLMALKEKKELYILAGNCDEVLRFITPPLKKEELLYYCLTKGHTIINEMAKKIKLKIDDNIDVLNLSNILEANFKKYYDFIDSFYDLVILNDKYVLVHGGIDDIDNIPEDNFSLLKYDSFYLKAKPSNYIRIVGHFPTINYSTTVPRYTPIFDFNKNVIAIDGGNKVKLAGQLNVVFLENDMFSYTYVDNYPKITAKSDLIIENNNPVHIDSYLERVTFRGERLGDYYVVYNQNNVKCYAYYKDVIVKDNFFFCYDASNYFMDLKKGEEYSLVQKANPFSIVKKKGIVGFLDTAKINDDEL